MKSLTEKLGLAFVLIAGVAFTIGAPAAADQVILDDLIVDGSACIGQDCVNGESFGFDTIRIKENNLRIKAQDTSNSASFPTRDWQITFNDSSNGGANKFSIDDIDGGRTPFTIEAGAPSHSLYVEDGGRVGFGTNTPVVDLHVKSGNTPTLRLEQDGSSGFAAQTWDVAGNEANFFVRDASNGSTLPFRIFPGAPTSALTIEGSTGDIGIRTTTPAARFHVENTSGQDTDDVVIDSAGHIGVGTVSPNTFAQVHLVEGSATGAIFRLESTNGTGKRWDLKSSNNGAFDMNVPGGAGVEFRLSSTGNLSLTGTITTTGSCSVGCDRVFHPDYPLESIDEHAALMWENNHLPAVGPTPEKGQYNLTEKTTGILNELEKAHIYIEQLHRRLETKESILEELSERLQNVEKRLEN